MPDQKIIRRELIWVTIVCMGFFLILLGSRVLNVPDEGRYAEVASGMLLSGDFITPKLNGVAFFHKPILYYWLECASFSVFGINEWSVRLAPAMVGVLGVVLTYIAGALLYNRRTGRLAALILATNPLYFLSSHYADMNLEVAVFISCSLLCFIVAMQYPQGNNRRNSLWSAYVFAALAVLTKGLIGIVFPMMVIGVWMLITRRWRLLREMCLPSGLLIFLVIAMPWYIAVQIRNPGFFNFFFIFQQFDRFTSTGFNNAFPFWFYLPVLLVGFLPWSITFLFGVKEYARLLWRKNKTFQTDLFLLLCLLLILGFFSIPESKIVGYILPVLPAMALLTAVFLDRRLTVTHETRSYFYAFFGVGFGALLLSLLMLLPMNHFHHKEVFLALKPYYLAVLITGGLCIVGFTLMRKATAALTTVAITGALFSLLLLILAGPISLARSVKPLALWVKERIQPGDWVVNYEDYYQDLGVYLQWPEHIIVVTDWQDKDIPKVDNWRSEFYFGFPDTTGEEAWMIDKPVVAQRLAAMNPDKTVYLFCADGLALQLEATYALHTVAEQNGIALLTNHMSDKMIAH